MTHGVWWVLNLPDQCAWCFTRRGRLVHQRNNVHHRVWCALNADCCELQRKATGSVW